MTVRGGPSSPDISTRPTGHQVGPWKALVSGWRVFVPVVVVNAGLQALTVIGDPVPVASWAFGLLVAGSLAVMVVSIAMIAAAALACVDGRARVAGAAVLRRPSILVWSLGLALLTIAGAVLNPLVAPLILLLGTFVLPAAADGARNPIAAGFRPVGRIPLRYLLAVIAFVVLVALGWVLALVLGFFVTGIVGAVATWIFFGVVAAVVLCLWSRLYRHGTAAGVA